MSATRVEIAVGLRSFCRWHERLRARLTRVAPKTQVWFRLVDDDSAPWPASLSHLLALERLLLRRLRPTLLDAASPDPRFVADDAPTPDLVVDLAGATTRSDGVRVLRPLYDGHKSQIAAAAALLAGAAPTIALEDAGSGSVVAAGLPSLEAADGLTGGLESVFSRLVTLIEKALLSPPCAIERPRAIERRANGAAGFFLRSLPRHVAREIYHLCCYSPHWRVGWRYVDGPGAIETGSLGGARWRIMRDRDLAFAADPFPIEWGGRTFVFYERLDYRTNKGAIFAREFGAAGPVCEPVPALEEPWHLSYPQLIALDGALYMLPEASLSGAVVLYRCVEFPSRWERVATLLDGVEAADATIFSHAGRYWMTSVVRDGWGGYSDTLAIHHAPSLLGPWTEHAQRPVLVDSRYARPAGAVVEHNGALLRPVQDCSTGYGKRLAIMRIDALDGETFRQTELFALSPGRLWPGNRLHTLNRWGRLECIDGAILSPKSRTLRRLTDAAIDRRAFGGADGDAAHAAG